MTVRDGPTVRTHPLTAVSGWWARRRRLRHGSAPLPAPTIVVGNLAWGGRGKTPMVHFVATVLGDAGLRVGIVTRGYGRRPGPPLTLVGAGVQDAAPWLAPVRRDSAPEAPAWTQASAAGDEAAWLAGALPTVPIRIDSDKERAGRFLVDHCGPIDVIVIDDGLQSRVRGDGAVVMVDSAKDRQSNALLREPWGHWPEGSLVVDIHDDAGESMLTAKRVATVLRDLQGARVAAPPRAVFAAAVGDPAAVETTASALGITSVGRVPTRDHHAPSAAALRRVAMAPALCITEKDATGWACVHPPHPHTVVLGMRLRFDPVARAALLRWLRNILPTARFATAD